ncbi:hypothetical protein PYH37_004436 [Sinorhizobium numidicum]|uniref:Uncharacterized protein n=1 Tax=Sinorhizobium numidicum TaxID=680248 RepID=A0ABY8CZG3_9HYPH|nr:hypothetical protein [Sinorhizobium numidicum]WEX76158.1 hypothetical protein PYH37_004436 [Sinorhizobium numidicum]WEX82817.1 hypothetical protein PYH38_005148 [Sinorhizobium numidicum]
MSSRFVIAIVALACTLAGIVISPVVARLPAFAPLNTHADAIVDRSGGNNDASGKAPHRGNSPGAATAVEIAETRKEDYPSSSALSPTCKRRPAVVDHACESNSVDRAQHLDVGKTAKISARA